MKKIVYIFIWGMIFYIAGLFRIESVLAAALAMAVFGVLLFLEVIIQSFLLQVTLDMEETWGKKGNDVSGKIVLHNKFFFPVSKMCIGVEYCYEPYGTKELKKIKGVLEGKGKGEVFFSVQPMYSGVVKIKLVWIKVWDILGIFGKKRKIGQEKEMVIFPYDLCMRINGDEIKTEMIICQDKMMQSSPGDTPPDVFQIHPYQPGEPIRVVHWKLSARLDDMMSRQYSKETQMLPVLYLYREKIQDASLEYLDAYWEMTEALSRGFMLAGISHVVIWNDQKECFHKMEIYGERDFLQTWKNAMLYSVEMDKQTQRKLYESLQRELGEYIPLVSARQDLSIWKNDKRMIQFSWKNYREEIEKRWFSV